MKIKRVEKFAVYYFLYIKNLIKLFLLEFKLAKKSVWIIALSTVAFIFMVFSFWLLLLLILTLFLQSLIHEWVISILLVMGINLFFIGILLWYITEYTENLKFFHTRRYIKLGKAS